MESHPGVTNAVITKTFVTGLGTIVYVADPFIVKKDDVYYLFFEIYKSGGIQTIAYGTSADGLAWTFGGEIMTAALTGSSMLSYPQVINVDGEWYMLPTSSNDEIALYKATTFPTTWVHQDVLIAGNWGPRDGTLFQFDGVFYMLVWDGTNNNCRLYFSDTLYGTGVWQEHPQSPILSGDRNSRPGGRPIVRAASIDVFFQDSVSEYGNKLRSYQITSLSKTTVSISELANSPILDADGAGWNSDGMHQLDRVDNTLSVVDGKDSSSNWSIGIYRDAP